MSNVKKGYTVPGAQWTKQPFQSLENHYGRKLPLPRWPAPPLPRLSLKSWDSVTCQAELVWFTSQ